MTNRQRWAQVPIELGLTKSDLNWAEYQTIVPNCDLTFAEGVSTLSGHGLNVLAPETLYLDNFGLEVVKVVVQADDISST